MKDDTASEQRVCPQCGNATASRLCPHDGWETIPTERVGAMPETPTEVLGRWHAATLLSQEGPLTMWGGREGATRRAVRIAIVTLPKAADLADVARMQRAAKTLEALRHPRLAKVLATGLDARGDLVIVSEQVTGPTLAEALAGGGFGSARTARLGVQLFDALEAAHMAGVMHHELTPERIRVVRDADGEGLVLQDIGIADLSRQQHGAHDVDPTLLKPITARYRAPEQSRDRAITRHADIYAAGAILYEMLVGRPVFNERTAADYLVAHLVKLPERPALAGVALEGPLVELVLRCLEKKPWNRPESAAAARDRLLAVSGDASELAAPQVRITTSSAVTMTTEDAPPPVPRAPRPQSAPTLPIVATPPMPPPVDEPPPLSRTIAHRPAPTLQLREHTRAASEPIVLREATSRRAKVWPWAAAVAALVLLAFLVVDGLGEPRVAGEANAPSVGRISEPEQARLATTATALSARPTPVATPAHVGEAPRTPEPSAPEPIAPEPADEVLVLEPLEEAPTPIAPKPAADKLKAAKSEPATEPVATPPETPRDAPPLAGGMRRAMLTSTPSGATVLVEGRALGKTPMTVQWSDGDEPTLQLKLAGYDAAWLSLEPESANRMLSLALIKSEKPHPPVQLEPTPEESAPEPTTSPEEETAPKSLLDRSWRPR